MPAKPAKKLIASDINPDSVFSTRVAAAPILPAAILTIESMKPLTTCMIVEIRFTNTITVS